MEAPSVSAWQPLVTSLEAQLPALVAAAATVPAASMAVVADGKLLWRGAAGVKDVVSREPVDYATVFETGSVSKTVFAYAVLKLYEKGIIDLDTPLTSYTAKRIVDDPRLDLITARHILSHTGGFQNWRTSKEPLRIGFTPGERWDYSGEGYSYLESIVTELTGHVDESRCRTFEAGVKACATDFDAYMKANLLMPFGMVSSGYLYQEGMARPHDAKGVPNFARKADEIEAARYGSAGGLHATATDYALFLIELLDPKPQDAFRLSEDTRKQMLRQQVKITDTLSWGLGWAIQRAPDGSEIIHHSGDNPGFKAMTAASIEKKRGFVIFTNGDRGFEEVMLKVMASAPMQAFLPVSLNG